MAVTAASLSSVCWSRQALHSKLSSLEGHLRPVLLAFSVQPSLKTNIFEASLTLSLVGTLDAKRA